MKIKIGDLTKRQITKICQQKECCLIVVNGYVCPLFNESKGLCMVHYPNVDDYDDIEVEIPEDV